MNSQQLLEELGEALLELRRLNIPLALSQRLEGHVNILGQRLNANSCTPEERAVIHAANYWHAEINRTRSASAIHVRLEDFEQELFAAVSRMLAAGIESENKPQ